MSFRNENEFMLGIAARLPELTDRDLFLMKEAGTGWLRCGDVHFDARAFIRGEPQGQGFQEAKRRIERFRSEGFRIMGLTPTPRDLKDHLGGQGTPEYFENYRRICAFIAGEFKGLIDWWQVGNELDIWIFREQLSLAQSGEFLKQGIRGVKEAAPEAKTGINITLFPSLPGEVDGNTEAHEGVTIARDVYGDPEVPVDYAGIDSYPGTWRKGGPDSWDEYLEGFYALTGKPIIVQEFGYSGAGEMMTPEEAASGAYPCELKKWRFGWREGHTPEVQSEYIREAFKIFASKPYVLGATYYNWRDARKCWQCLDPDCPAETAWGLLDREGEPKASYFGFKNAVAEIFGNPACV
jgi:hypothetical protein